MQKRLNESVKALSMVKMHGKEDAIKHATQCMYMANEKGYDYWKKVISIIEGI
jgi:hypothetical protein